MGVIESSLQSCNDLCSKDSFLMGCFVVSIARNSRCILSMQSVKFGILSSRGSPLSEENRSSILVQMVLQECGGKILTIEKVVHIELRGEEEKL